MAFEKWQPDREKPRQVRRWRKITPGQSHPQVGEFVTCMLSSSRRRGQDGRGDMIWRHDLARRSVRVRLCADKRLSSCAVSARNFLFCMCRGGCCSPERYEGRDLLRTQTTMSWRQNASQWSRWSMGNANATQRGEEACLPCFIQPRTSKN